jgi:hypothetical protein
MTSSGTLVFTLANDLNAIEGLTGTGIAVRTASNTWVNRIITGSGGIVITNPGGVSGDINIDGSGISGGSGNTNLSFNGTTTIDTLRSSSGTDVVFQAGTNIVFDISTANKLIINNTFTEVDGSVTNELQTFSTTGLTTTLSGGAGSIAFSAGANMTITNIGTSQNPIYNFASAGGGGSSPTDLAWVNWTFNQWALTSSTGNDVILNLSGGGFTSGLSGNSLNIVANDQSATNEIQTLSYNSGTNQLSLSLGGGTVTLNTSGISGSGTTNFIPLWTSATSQGNSIVSYNGSNSIQVGSAAGALNKIYFGDGTFVYVGEGTVDDRLYLRGESLTIDINDYGGTGAVNQVLKNLGGGLTGWGTDTDTDDQTLSFNSGTGQLTISEGNTVTITAGGGATATDLSFTTGVGGINLLSSSGADVFIANSTGATWSQSGSTTLSLTLADNSSTNEIQTLGASAGQITLSGSTPINLAATGLATITASGNIITVGATYSDPDASATNEAQTISLSSNIITLSSVSGIGGGTVNLAPYVNTVSNIVAGTGGISVSSSSGTFTINNTFVEVDGSTTNELQSFTTSGLIASLSGVSSSIGMASGTGITVTNTGTSTNPVFTITNTSTNTDNQSLSLSGQSLGISGGGTGVTLPVINVSAGSGISVSASSGNYTITNTSPGITYTGGTGISVSGSTITNTAPGQIHNSVSYNGNATIATNVTVATQNAAGSTLTLPLGASIGDGKTIYVMNFSAGSITVQAQAGNTLTNTSSSVTIPFNKSAIFHSNANGNWVTIISS